MNGLMEFVFEDIAASNVAGMIAAFVPDVMSVSEVTRDGEPLPINWPFDSDALPQVVSSNEDAAVVINVRSLAIGDKSVRNATIRILRYGGVNDVSVLATSTDCKACGINTANELFRWAKTVSERYCVSNFYGGFDPAFDERTQLYSKSGVGPIVEL